jgi:hypothetical protein
MRFQLSVACFLLVASGLVSNCLAEDSDWKDAKFQELHQSLQPRPDELWRTIPWKTSVLDAQQAAVKENKPIFIWAMDGHPLGCT